MHSTYTYVHFPARPSHVTHAGGQARSLKEQAPSADRPASLVLKGPGTFTNASCSY